MNHTPEPTLIPYVLVEGAARAIDFYSRVFSPIMFLIYVADVDATIERAEARER